MIASIPSDRRAPLRRLRDALSVLAVASTLASPASAIVGGREERTCPAVAPP
ncbi:hypothetical protein ACFQWF_26265 [Methylorubrum suomiense]